MTDFEYIKTTRKENRLTQKELSEVTGISLRTIQRIENGEVSPRPFTIRKLEQALGIKAATNSHTYDAPKSNLTILKWLLGLSICLPVVYSVIVYLFWKKNEWSPSNETVVARTVYLNLITACFVIPILVLILLSILRSFDVPVQVRHVPTVLLIYWGLALLNLWTSYSFLETTSQRINNQ